MMFFAHNRRGLEPAGAISFRPGSVRLSLGVAFFEFSWALAVVAAVCGELTDCFVSPFPFEMAPKPTSAREALSNAKNRLIKRRRLEKAN